MGMGAGQVERQRGVDVGQALAQRRRQHPRQLGLGAGHGRRDAAQAQRTGLGLRGGLAAVAGIVAGGVVHVVVAATGVAALWLAWPAGFNALLLAGAAYMAWIGWSLLRVHDAASLGATAGGPRRGWAIFRRGALTCLLNPKAYAFMLAVFPAFLAGGGTGRSLLAQSASLSAVIAGTQIAVYGAVAVAAAGAGRWGADAGADGSRALRWATRGVGLILLLGALAAPVMGWRSLA